MKYYDFDVAFTDGETIQVSALNQVDATILAQAERIKAGKHYRVLSVEVAK